MRIRACGDPGHGSIPHNRNAVVKLCKSMGRLHEMNLPLHPSATMIRFLDEIASGQEADLATDLRELADPQRSAAAFERLTLPTEFKAELGALLRNTASVTMLEAGSKINVIPATATAWVDGRLAPGETMESFVAELRPYIGNEVEVEIDQYSPPLEASPESQLFQTVVDVMAQHDPQAPVVPSLMAGGTDAKHICPRRPHTQVYGFMPYRQQPGLEEMRLVHGHDERTSVDNLVFATRIIYDIVCRFCGGS
jgi:acetylornithine deacetylase/succinyl-diaminopimelate desuccinylase-like protein